MTIRTFKAFTPKIDPTAYVDDHALVIGNVIIGQDTSIWPMAVIRGDMHQIQIGDRTNIQDGAICHVTQDDKFTPGGFPLTIGDSVTIGHQAILHGCQIGNNCLIGIGSIVLDGAIIPPKTIIAAGSLIPPGKKLKSGYLWIGRPAIQKRPLTEMEIAQITDNAKSYVALKNDYLNT